MSNQKAYIRTFGCQMNEHDSGRMRHLLAASGYVPTDTPDDANLILVNTCSVRHNPENKVYSLLGTLRARKEQDPNVIIGVAGCVAQQEGTRILARERAVDLVFGPDNLFRLPEFIDRVQAG